LFDIDTLTMSMNYQPVVAGNQPDDNSDPHNTDDDVVDVANAAFNVKENENAVHVRDLRAEFEEFSFNSTNRVNAVSAPVNVAGLNLTNSTNRFNTASNSVNVVSPNFGIARKSSFVDPSKYQNRLLVTKPYNKTPYELLLGRSPSIRFMRHFGCPVTILNTLDPLEKFDGKADEGFLGNPQQAQKDKGVIDSGYSRHITGNISFLSDFEEIDGGYVAFGGNPKGVAAVKLMLLGHKLMVLRCLSGKRIAWNKFICSMASAVICLATDQPSTPPQEQPTTTSKSSMSLLITLMETYASLSQKVAKLEQDKHTQALEILKLEKREDASKQGGKIEAINANEDITLQFWATTTIKKVNDVVQLHALIDGKKVVILDDVIRRDIYLDDADGVECLLNEDIFIELARMGYEKPHPKLTFYKAFFSA
nr:ribonuclease H-like domain-containing protein [Tanacetum cinerariifolium]